MNEKPAAMGTQTITHQGAPKTETLSSDLDEKISLSSTTHSSSHSNHNTTTTTPTKPDLETATTTEEDETTTTPATPIKIARSQRRGLFGRFTLVAEVEEPKHYPRRTKWFITFNIALAAVAAPLGSAIIFRKVPPLSPHLT